jgi:hypothetical protein
MYFESGITNSDGLALREHFTLSIVHKKIIIAVYQSNSPIYLGL